MAYLSLERVKIGIIKSGIAMLDHRVHLEMALEQARLCAAMKARRPVGGLIVGPRRARSSASIVIA